MRGISVDIILRPPPFRTEKPGKKIPAAGAAVILGYLTYIVRTPLVSHHLGNKGGYSLLTPLMHKINYMFLFRKTLSSMLATIAHGLRLGAN